MLVVAAAIHSESGHVLMQRRPDASMHGGLWEFPGGKVEPGETPEEALAREIDEEMGLAIAAADLAPVGFASARMDVKHGDSGPGRPIVILLYACPRWKGEPEARDGASLGWYPAKALAGLDMPPLDYPLAQALERYLDHGTSTI